MEKITERLRAVWESSGLQQKEFAGRCGIDRSSLNLLLNGKRRPDLDTLAKICTTFSVSADYLIGIADNSQPDPNLRAACEILGLSGEAAAAIRDMPNKEILNQFISDKRFRYILAELAASRMDERQADYHCYRATRAFEEWWNPGWGMPWEEAQKGWK